jgi:hypothetical protein
MGKPSLRDRIRDKISDILFALFLRVNNTSRNEYYGRWAGYTKEDFEAMTTSEEIGWREE